MQRVKRYGKETAGISNAHKTFLPVPLSERTNWDKTHTSVFYLTWGRERDLSKERLSIEKK